MRRHPGMLVWKRVGLGVVAALGLLSAGVGEARKAAGQGAAAEGREKAKAKIKEPDILYVPTPPEVVARMLELAELKEGDVLYDLGCGDGRIVIGAAKKYGAKGVGFDVDPKRIEQSRENAKKAGVEGKVSFRQQDIFEVDLKDADVVTLYLLPRLNVALMPQLRKLRPGARIISHAFDMRGARPKRVVKMKNDHGTESTIYLWVVPWEKEDA